MIKWRRHRKARKAVRSVHEAIAMIDRLFAELGDRLTEEQADRIVSILGDASRKLDDVNARFALAEVIVELEKVRDRA